jgi:hypothetical protein
MNIDPNNLPAEVWAIDRARVRAGKGPVRVVPVGPSQTTINGVPCGIEGRANGKGPTNYYTTEWLFPTEAEAKLYGAAIARQEAEHEREKYRALTAKLQAAFDACQPPAAQE